MILWLVWIDVPILHCGPSNVFNHTVHYTTSSHDDVRVLCLFLYVVCMWNAVMSCMRSHMTCVVARRYLLRSRPQLSQAGCQVLGTLTQLHGRSLIFHRGNRWLGRGHHLTPGLQNGKRYAKEGLRLTENVFIKKWYFLPGHSGFASKPSVAVRNNKNKALIIC